MSVLRELRQRGQLLVFSMVAAVRGIRDNLRYVIIQPYALSLGIPVRSIGALESLADLSKIVLTPIMGAASDTYGRRRFLILRELLPAFAAVLFLFARSWRLYSLGMILLGFSWSLLPVWNSVIAEAAEAGQMGRVYSIIGGCYTGMGLVGTLCAGWLTDNFGYSTVFMLSTAFGVVSLILTWLKIHETQAPREDARFTWREALGSLIDSLRPPRYLWGYYAAMSVDLFAFSLGWRLISGMLTESYGYTPSTLSLLFAVNTATISVFTIVLGRYVDRVGYVKYLAISQCLSCIFLAMVLMDKSFRMVFAANVVMGFSAAFWIPAEQAWIASNARPSERAKIISGYSTFRGLAALPAPFIGGLLYDLYGFDVPIMINLALVIVDIALLLVLVKDKALPENPE